VSGIARHSSWSTGRALIVACQPRKPRADLMAWRRQRAGLTVNGPICVSRDIPAVVRTAAAIQEARINIRLGLVRERPDLFDMEVIVRRQGRERCASITCMIRHYVARRAQVIEDHPHNAAFRARLVAVGRAAQGRRFAARGPLGGRAGRACRSVQTRGLWGMMACAAGGR
jgi:hypothetical protein